MPSPLPDQRADIVGSKSGYVIVRHRDGQHMHRMLLAVGHIRTVRYSIARSFPGRARSARFWFLSQRGSTKSWSSV